MNNSNAPLPLPNDKSNWIPQNISEKFILIFFLSMSHLENCRFEVIMGRILRNLKGAQMYNALIWKQLIPIKTNYVHEV